jgi:uncharacterized protein
MKKEEILEHLRELKPIYEQEGVILLGLFGSHSRGEATPDSDIDILYDVDADKFCKLYPGFKAFGRLEGIKQELSNIFHSHIDLATIDNDSKTFKTHALKDAIYV